MAKSQVATRAIPVELLMISPLDGGSTTTIPDGCSGPISIARIHDGTTA
jgi:hypothetical protein